MMLCPKCRYSESRGDLDTACACPSCDDETMEVVPDVDEPPPWLAEPSLGLATRYRRPERRTTAPRSLPVTGSPTIH